MQIMFDHLTKIPIRRFNHLIIMGFCYELGVHVSYVVYDLIQIDFSGRIFSFSIQPISFILCFICVSVIKTIFKKGHKSQALRLLGILLVLMALVGLVSYFISFSTEQTQKVSFKAAGVKYREQFTVTEILSRPEVRYKNTTQNDSSLNTTNENSLVAETEPAKNLTNSTLAIDEKQLVGNMKISSDLQVLSSFDCVKSIPRVLTDYMSNMFLNQYGRSHEDFHTQQRTDVTLPKLEKFNIDCGVDQNCSTWFQYDKQYGLSTTADNTYQGKEIFYCCPSVHSLTLNETISKVCRRAQSVAGKSVFRESKEPTFLERVIMSLLLMRYLGPFLMGAEVWQFLCENGGRYRKMFVGS